MEGNWRQIYEFQQKYIYLHLERKIRVLVGNLNLEDVRRIS